MKKALLGVVSVASFVAATMVGLSCGRPDDAELDASKRSGGDYTPVDGLAAYGSQCPYGDVGNVKPLRLQMWNCPIGPGTVRLTDNITPLYLQADCKSRILSVRTMDHKIDTSWYFLPNGEFDVIIDGITARLKSDGSGHSDCNAPLAINLMGKVSCGPDGPNQDKATVRFQSVMWAGKRLEGRGANPIVEPSATPNGLPPRLTAERVEVSNQCKLPTSCYLYTQTELTQCQ